MAVQNVRNGRSMSEVLQDIVGDVQEIIRYEVRLAKAEITEEGAKTASACKPLGIGLLLALYAVGLILLAIVRALSAVLDGWLASLVVGVAVLVVSMILVRVGRKRLKEVKVVPEKTIRTVKENLQWAKDQIR
jgi:uncharacterized membrane protein YqjE